MNRILSIAQIPVLIAIGYLAADVWLGGTAQKTTSAVVTETSSSNRNNQPPTKGSPQSADRASTPSPVLISQREKIHHHPDGSIAVTRKLFNHLELIPINAEHQLDSELLHDLGFTSQQIHSAQYAIDSRVRDYREKILKDLSAHAKNHGGQSMFRRADKEKAKALRDEYTHFISAMLQGSAGPWIATKTFENLSATTNIFEEAPVIFTLKTDPQGEPYVSQLFISRHHEDRLKENEPIDYESFKNEFTRESSWKIR